MRVQPLPPDTLGPDLRQVHDEIAKLVGRSQGQVTMIDAQGALIGPFPPLLRYPQFGIPALTFLRSLDTHATLDKAVREVAILTVGAAYGARFELYAMTLPVYWSLAILFQTPPIAMRWTCLGEMAWRSSSTSSEATASSPCS